MTSVIGYVPPNPILFLFVGLVVSIFIYISSNRLAVFVYDYFELSTGKERTARMFRDAITVSTMIVSVQAAIESSSFNEYLGITESLLLTVGILVWSRPVYHTVSEVISEVVSSRYDSEVTPIVQNFWVLSLISISVLLLFNVWNIDVTPLLASAGVVGIVLGLAARETISNFFGSIALYADDTYQIGDYIEVEGEAGFVSDISVRSTQLRTISGNMVTIPNSRLHKSIIKNKDTPDEPFRIKMEIGVSYDTPPDKSRKVIRDTVEECIQQSGRAGNIVSNSKRESKVFLDSFGDSSINFVILAWVDTPYQEPKLKDIIYDELQTSLEQHNISIPYPQRSVNISE